MKDKVSFDVFLSHNTQDKPVVERLAARLEDEARLRPFLDKWHLIPGDPWQEALEAALDNSNTCAVLLGPGGLGPWENQELRSSLDERVSGSRIRVIPVLLPGANPQDPKTLPRFLRGITWVDFRGGIDDDYAFASFVSGIRGEPPGRHALLLPSRSLFVRSKTRELMESALKRDMDISGLWYSDDTTLHSLAKRCSLAYPGLEFDQIRAKLRQARSEAFTKKYAHRTKKDDERYLDFDGWQGELMSILLRLGLKNIQDLKAINVGIGNGLECPGWYSAFKVLCGVDVSEQSLHAARLKLKNMTPCVADAEHLDCVRSNEYDLYISLRTYQSSLIDIEEALFEAYRVLAPGGYCILSIPYIYAVDGRVYEGLLRHGSDELDRDLPYVLTDRLRRGLGRLNFDHIGIHTGLFEVYTYGRRGR